MACSGRDLLRQLEPAVRPVDVHALAGRTPIDEADFAELLGLARDGTLASDRPLETSRLAAPLGEEDCRRLGRAIDLLEASGARSAIIVYGPRPFVVDVATRTFERELTAQESPELVAVDAALRVARPEEPLPIRPPGPPQAVPAAAGAYDLLEARDSLLALRS